METEMNIIAYHFYRSTPNALGNQVALWGNLWLTYFFLLSGKPTRCPTLAATVLCAMQV